MGERLRNLGFRTRHIRHQAICLHLNHGKGYWHYDEMDKNLPCSRRPSALAAQPHPVGLRRLRPRSRSRTADPRPADLPEHAHSGHTLPLYRRYSAGHPVSAQSPPRLFRRHHRHPRRARLRRHACALPLQERAALFCPASEGARKSQVGVSNQSLGLRTMLRARRYDRVYILARSFSSAILPLLAGIPHRVGFATEGRAGCSSAACPTGTSTRSNAFSTPPGRRDSGDRHL